MASSLESERKVGVHSHHFESENDEDEELAALREAALMSLKPIEKHNKSPVTSNNSRNSSKSIYKRPIAYRESLHTNSFGSNRSNIGYNKPKWRQPSNLIVINTVPIEDKRPISENSVPNLMLPQDKWCPINKPNSSKSDHKSPKGPKKFSRIRSNSDSESDYEQSDSDSCNENMGKNNSYTESKDLVDACGSLMSEDEIDLNNSQELDIALFDDELAPVENPIDLIEEDDMMLNNVAQEEVETETESVCPEDDHSRDSVNNDITSNSSTSAASDSVSDVGDAEVLNQDDPASDSDSDLGSCVSIELEHPEYNEMDSERTNSLQNGVELTELEKTRTKISFNASESEPIKDSSSSSDIVKNDLPSSDIPKKSHRERSPKGEKAPIDLRLLLKAKRGEKPNSKKDKSLKQEKLQRSPIVKSVLSVVKSLRKREDKQDEREKREKRFDGTVSVGTGSGIKVRLLKDNTQVTVLTDKKDREDKKSSVHKRLGPYAKPSRNSDQRESRNISRTVVNTSKFTGRDSRHKSRSLENDSKKSERSSSESSSSSSRHRSSSSSRNKSSYKRLRVSGHHSGY